MAHYYEEFEQEMKWHHFLAYLGLWLIAALEFFYYLLYSSNLGYGRLTNSVYEEYPTMKTVDIIYANTCLIIAVISIFSAVGLLHLKKFGPVGVILLIVVYLVSDIYIFIKLSNSTVDSSSSKVDETTFIKQILVSIVLIILNSIYFYKRRKLYN